MLLLLRTNPDSILSEDGFYLSTESSDVLVIDNTPISIVGEVKVWTGSTWTAKPSKYWNGSAWVTKPTKVWSGTGWVVTNY